MELSIDDIPQAVKSLREEFATHKTKTYEWRIAQLRALHNMITENRQALIEAVQNDLGKKVPFEIIMSEINLPLAELEDTIHHLRQWMAPQWVPSNLAGGNKHPPVVFTKLIYSPWNYPINLALTPLIGALAGGNTVFLKASRHSVNTGATLERLIPKYLDNSCVRVESKGGVDMITRLLEEQWDHIFFTGSVDVGRVVYQAAAKNLTPVVLELGGKNPAIVDKNVDIDFAAKRLAWGKFWNCGQTCITADYVLVHKDVEKQLIEALKKKIFEFHGQDPQRSDSYCRIISLRQLKRLEQMISKSGTVAFGGKVDEVDLYLSPTLMTDVPLDSPLMNEEIFGPVLPIIPVDSIQHAVDFCNSRPHPLALYVFSRDESVQDEVFSKTRSGAAIANDLLVHFTNPNLPFGGVGDSGVGAYHGKRTFDTFTHKRAVVKSTSNALLDLPLKYPPYTPHKQMIASFLTAPGFEKKLKGFSKLVLALVALGVARIVLVRSSRL